MVVCTKHPWGQLCLLMLTEILTMKKLKKYVIIRTWYYNTKLKILSIKGSKALGKKKRTVILITSSLSAEFILTLHPSLPRETCLGVLFLPREIQKKIFFWTLDRNLICHPHALSPLEGWFWCLKTSQIQAVRGRPASTPGQVVFPAKHTPCWTAGAQLELLN